MAEVPIKFTFEDESFKKMASQMNQLYKDAQKFQKAINGGEDKSDNLNKLKKTTKYMEDIVNLQNKHAIEARKTGGLVGGLEKKTKQLKLARQGTDDPKLIKRYNSELRKTQRQITKLKDTTGSWGKAMGSFQFKFNALGNIAANVASSITNGITRSIRGAIDSVVDFEKSFAEVLTLLNKADKVKFADLLKGDSVAIMRKYGLTIKDTNKAMFDAISAGVKAADVFNVLDAAAKLAVGGVTDLNSSVKGIASVMNAFSLSSSEALDVASAFFQAQKFGITYIDDMVASMGRANTIASLSGASYREMLAAFTAITKSGLNTEEAITGLRNVFKELVSPSKEARDMLNSLNIAVGSNAVQSRGFIGVLDDLNREFNKNNEIVPQIFGNIRGLTGVMGIVGTRYKDFRFILNQVNNAMASNEALNDAVSTQMDTLAKKADQVKAAWDTMFISIEDGGGQAGSVIKDLLDAINILIRKLTPDYFEGYTEAMATAAKKSSSIINGWKKEIEALGGTQEEQTAKLIKVLEDEILVREKAYKKSESLYKKELTTLDEKRAKLISMRTGEQYGSWAMIKNLEQEIITLEKSVDSRDLIAKKDKAIYEGVLNGLTDLTEERVKSEEEIKKMSEEERKAYIKKETDRLKLQQSINQSILRLREASYKQQQMLLKDNYDYEVRIINLTVDDEELALQERYDAQLKYYVKLDELRKKYAIGGIKSKDPKDLIDEGELTEIVPRIAPEVAPGGDKSPMAEAMGLTDDELDALRDAAKEAEDIIKEITDAIVDAADERVNAIQREIDMSNQRVDELQRDRDLEWERMQQGYANNFDLAQKELQDEKARREQLRLEEEKALVAKKKAADAQIAVNAVLQLSNLALTATEIFLNEGKLGVAGIPIAIAGIAAIFGALTAFKANAKKSVGFADGVIGLSGNGTEKSDSINARLSKGESVMTAEATKPNKKNLTTIQRNPRHPLFQLTEKLGADNVLNSLANNMSVDWAVVNSPDNRWDELLYQEIKEHNQFIRQRPYSYREGGDVVTIKGNEVNIYRKK